MRNNTKKQLIYNICLLSALLILVVVICYAWFTSRSKVTASGVDIDVSENISLSISSDNGTTWSDKATFNVDKKFRFSPVCGNGYSFFTPVIDKSEEDVLNEDEESTGVKKPVYDISSYSLIGEEDLSDYIMSYDFQLKSDGKLDVYFDLENSSINSPRASSKSLEGLDTNLSAAAMRVALYQKFGEAYTLKCVWLPDSDYHLNDIVEDKYIFVNSEGGNDSLEISNEDGTEAVVDGVKYSWDNSGSIKFTSLTENVPAECRVVIWLDGTDNECDNALLSPNAVIPGMIKLNIKFTSEPAY